MEPALAGLSYDEIAQQVGYASRGSAWRAVRASWHEVVVERVEEYRQVELDEPYVGHRVPGRAAVDHDQVNLPTS